MAAAETFDALHELATSLMAINVSYVGKSDGAVAPHTFTIRA